LATPEQKAAAKKQRRYIVTKRPYYPSMAEITEAFKWLADRGFGQAPKTVQIEGSVTTGFKMVFRKWAPGTDPASLPLSEMPKSIVVSARMLEAPKNGKPGANGSNGHTTAGTGTGWQIGWQGENQFEREARPRGQRAPTPA